MILVVILIFFVTLSKSEYIDLKFDEDFPIIITDKFMNDTNFGTTVSLSSNSLDSAISPTGWLFIGAPTSGSTKDTSNKNFDCARPKKPGVLWRCSLGRVAAANADDAGADAAEDNCEIVQLELEHLNGSFPGKPKYECKEDNLLGISLTSDNERLVTCSPKWTRGGIYMNGLCYWLDKKAYTKDVASIAKQSSYNHRLIPFFLKTKDNENQYYATNKQDLALGQAGMSAHVTYVKITNNETSERLLIGAPGVLLWSGAIAIYTDNVKPKEGSDRTRLNRNKGSSFSEYIVLQRGKATKKSTEADVETSNVFGYFGYAVASGNVGTKPFYVGGSPRGNDLIGEAVVFKYPANEELSKTSNLRFDIDKYIISTLKPMDGSFGSYFGSVLHTMDVFENGDIAADEIFVGAPLFSNNERWKRDTGSSEKVIKDSSLFGDHGAVFIFHYDTGTGEFMRHPQVLHGNGIPGARFGSAISSVTKISKNQQITIKQLVVGAPYENCGFEQQSSCGAVYIYEPVKDFSKVELKLKHKIDPRKWELPLPLRGFGSSLSLGVDIDYNDTPDIAIGAHQSQKVIVLRSRIPFKLIGKISFFDRKGTPIEKFSKTLESLIVRSCILIEPYKDFDDLTDELDITSKLSIDRIFNRFSIEHSEQNSESYHGSKSGAEFTRTVSKNEPPKCTDFTLKLNTTYFDNNRNRGKHYPAIEVVQDMSYNFLKYGMKARQLDVEDNYGKRIFVSAPIIKFKDFKPRTPFSTIVQSKSSLTITECRGVTCQPNITLSANWFHSSDHNRSKPITEYTIGSTMDLILLITIDNSGEIAFNPNLTIDWEGVKTKDMSSECGMRNAESTQKRAVACIYDFIAGQTQKTVTLKFDMRYLYAKHEAKENKFEVNIAVLRVVNDKSRRLITLSKTLPLRVDSGVTITGSRDYLTLATPFTFKITPNLGVSDGNSQIEETKMELYNSVPLKFEIHLKGSPLEKFKTVFKIPIRKKGTLEDIILVQSPTKRQSSRSAYELGSEAEECNARNFTFHKFVRQIELPPVDSGTENPTTTELPSSGANEVESRRKRSNDENTVGKLQSSRKEPKIKKTSNTNYISCDDFDCMEITCIVKRKTGALKNVNREEIFPIVFDLYMVKNLTDDLIKTSQKEAILIEARGQVEIFRQGHQNHKIDDDVSQTLLTKMAGKVPLWVYAVAALIALLLLAVIVLGLYKCGFFKRETHEKLIIEKAEERRKSMMVPRHSSGGVTYDTFGSSQDDLLNDDNADALEQTQEASVNTDNDTSK